MPNPASLQAPDNSWQHIADARSPWSIRGHIKIHPWVDWPTIQSIVNWRWISQEGTTQRDLISAEKRPLDGKNPAIRFQGIGDRNGAETLMRGSFWARHTDLPPLSQDAYYWKDLLGINVVNTKGETMGIVSKVGENLANSFFTITPPPPKKPFSIPYIEKYVKSINLNTRSMLVDWELAWLE